MHKKVKDSFFLIFVELLENNDTIVYNMITTEHYKSADRAFDPIDDINSTIQHSIVSNMKEIANKNQEVNKNDT